MKWKDLTPKQLRSLAGDLYESAHDRKVEREMIEEHRGFDVVAALECVGRRLNREAKRRDAKLTKGGALNGS